MYITQVRMKLFEVAQIMKLFHFAQIWKKLIVICPKFISSVGIQSNVLSLWKYS